MCRKKLMALPYYIERHLTKPVLQFPGLQFVRGVDWSDCITDWLFKIEGNMI